MKTDVVVLGAGIEGLAAAATLAKGGRAVTVLEARAQPGGSAAREEFQPGFFASGVTPEASLTRRALLSGLELERHGLAWRERAPAPKPNASNPSSKAAPVGIVTHKG